MFVESINTNQGGVILIGIGLPFRSRRGRRQVLWALRSGASLPLQRRAGATGGPVPRPNRNRLLVEWFLLRLLAAPEHDHAWLDLTARRTGVAGSSAFAELAESS
jgi:hypothetical protein